MQFWPPDDEHICSKHVEAWNKLIVKQKVCTSSWLITEINLCVVYVVGYSGLKLHNQWILRSYPFFYSIKSQILKAKCVDSYNKVIIPWHFALCPPIKFLKTTICGGFFFSFFPVYMSGNEVIDPTALGSLAELYLNHRLDFQRDLA